MALPTFYFQASLPASHASLEVLGPLVNHVLTYCGYSDAESRAIADQMHEIAGSDRATGHVTITFEREVNDLWISVHASHLAAKTPDKGLMDAVSVHQDESGRTYRYHRRVPEGE